MNVPKTRCGGLWSESRFASFIKSALRSASHRWAPKHACRKAARTARNKYLCAECGKTVGSQKIRVDHIQPVVSVEHGFRSWDEYIARMFVEIDGYRAICEDCHAIKTAQERAARKEHKHL